MTTDATDQTITCCKRCKTPLVWTYIYPGAEQYCIECGTSFGFLDGGKIERKATPGMIKRKEQVDKQFKKAVEGYAYGGCTYDNCHRCQNPTEPNDKYHIWHLTDDEKKAHAAAMKRLERLKSIQLM